jgi:hypothetical protein
MYKLILSSVLALLLSSFSFAEEPFPVVYQGTEPVKTSDPELKDLYWHRWTTKNFTVLSLDEKQGNFLAQNIENIKKSTYMRWGLDNQDFSRKCKILAVYDKDLLKRLFRINESRVEVRENEIVAWILSDDVITTVLPPPLTEVCMSEIEKQGKHVGFWMIKGMGTLNGSVSKIKENVMSAGDTVAKNSKVFLSEKLFTMTKRDWEKLNPQQRALFDKECVILCLLLRKEFGEFKFLSFMNNKDQQQMLQVIGFKDYGQFDASFVRYTKDLHDDLKQSITPNHYLQIEPVR